VILIRAEGAASAPASTSRDGGHPERIVELNAGNYATSGGASQPEAGDRGCSTVSCWAAASHLGAADILIASEDAKFACGDRPRCHGRVAHLRRLLPVKSCVNLAFTGEMISATDAYPMRD